MGVQEANQGKLESAFQGFGVKEELMLPDTHDFPLNFGHLDQDGFVSFMFREEEPPCFQSLATFDPAAQIDDQVDDEWGEASPANHPTQVKTELETLGQLTGQFKNETATSDTQESFSNVHQPDQMAMWGSDDQAAIDPSKNGLITLASEADWEMGHQQTEKSPAHLNRVKRPDFVLDLGHQRGLAHVALVEQPVPVPAKKKRRSSKRPPGEFVYNPDLPFGCNRCQESFGDVRTLMDHLRAAHNYVQPKSQKLMTGLAEFDDVYQCRMCGIAYNWYTSLKRHMVIHTGEASHTCRASPQGLPLCDNKWKHLQTEYRHRANCLKAYNSQMLSELEGNSSTGSFGGGPVRICSEKKPGEMNNNKVQIIPLQPGLVSAQNEFSHPSQDYFEYVMTDLEGAELKGSPEFSQN